MTKFLIISSLLLGLNSQVLCQKFQNGYWLPEKYLQIIKETKNRKVADSSIKWIYSIRTYNDTIYVQCLKKDFYDVDMIKIDSTTTEIEKIGWAGNPKQYEDYKNYRFFIIPFYDKILLKQIYKDSIVDSIIFTNKIDGKTDIGYPDNSIYQIIYSGTYNLMLPNKAIIDQDIILTDGGEIIGSSIFENYTLNSCPLYEDISGFGRCINRAKFNFKNSTPKEFAQFKKDNLLYLFEYYFDNHYYKLGNLIYILEKIK